MNVEINSLQQRAAEESRKIRYRSAVFILLLILFFIQSSSLSAQNIDSLFTGLDNPTSLYVTSNSLYVVEQGNNRLLRFNHNGKLLETIGGNGSGNYNFSKPIDVHATNGLKIYVTDNNNRRIQVFDRRGQFLSSISTLQDFDRRRSYSPTQISVDNLREIIFFDERTSSIVRFNEDADLIDEFRIPGEVAQVDDLMVVDQLMYILDKKAGLIHVLSENGRYESFFPAKNVLAFYTDGETVWKCYPDKITMEGRNTETQSSNFDVEIEAVDMQVDDEIIFILTANSLLKYNV